MCAAFVKQYSSGELIHGSSDWRMIRPATPDEISYDTFHKHYARQGIGRFVYNSKKPFGEEEWRKALRHTTNKVEVLRLCLKEKEGNLMLYELQNHDIDFKIIENKSSLEVAEDMKNEGLDLSFWSARVVPAVPGEVYPIPDIKEEFPHQYNFIFKFHHGLWDGGTFQYFFRVFSEILDDILCGKTVNDDIKFGKFQYENPLETKIKEVQQTLESDPLRLDEEKKQMLSLTMKPPILYSAFPVPKGVKATTHHIIRNIDNAHIDTLHKYCKSRKVTVTAGFEAVFNTALVEMVTDAGVVEDGYKINIRQNINMRRYFKVDKDFTKFPLGCFLGGMQQEAFCKKSPREHFWEHAQEVSSNFHSLLKNDGPIIESVVRPLVQGPLDPEMLANGPPQDMSDYAFSNVLDVTRFVFYEGAQVQLTNIIAYNFINNFLHPMLFQFSTFRGFGTLSLSHDTGKVTDETANELMDRIMDVLEYVTRPDSKL
ncbi:unnamed protein product [Meganyctiphanes norvegica]|uniref:Condensation domain-containing protein n=1 Tax=Meganyctiphanes norvegica TaxID=48144 RepID=A0AAV2Q6Q1_MEGNR